MTIVRFLGVVKNLATGMIAGLAVVALGLLVYVAALGFTPRSGRDPVARFDLADVSPPEVSAEPPAYQPIADRIEQTGLFAALTRSALPAFAGLTASTGSANESQAARDTAESHAAPPQLDLPETGLDEPFRFKADSKSPTMPNSGSAPQALPIVGAALSVGPSAGQRSDRDTAPIGPEHFLQGGYFAFRENAVGLSRELANAGLDVLMEQTTNRADKTRWRVLIGPYRQKEDALQARSAAPNLLAKAFYIKRNN